jgi:hypothetical protein
MMTVGSNFASLSYKEQDTQGKFKTLDSSTLKQLGEVSTKMSENRSLPPLRPLGSKDLKIDGLLQQSLIQRIKQRNKTQKKFKLESTLYHNLARNNQDKISA